MKFEQYLNGMVELRLPAQKTEELLQQMIAADIPVYQVKRQTDYVYLWVHLDDYFKLRHFLREQHCRFHVQQRLGLPFVISRIKRRRGLLLGLGLGLSLLYLLLSFIWGYEVHGNLQYSDDHMIALVQEYGMIPGAHRDKFDYDALAEQIVRDHPEFTWIQLQVVGTTLQIDVKERLSVSEMPQKSGSLVAQADGRITELLVFRGTPLVKRGDWVHKGQILVGGWDYPDRQRNQKGEFVPVGEPYAVKAQAVISGEKERRAVGSCALEERMLVSTGKEEKQIALAWQGHQLILWGKQQSLYPYSSQTIEQHSIVTWKQHQLPVYVRTTIVAEKTLREVCYTKEEAFATAVERARKRLQEQMPAGSRFLRESVGMYHPEMQNVVQAEVVWMVEENLAQMQQKSLPPTVQLEMEKKES